jgi:hypothetical protein
VTAVGRFHSQLPIKVCRYNRSMLSNKDFATLATSSGGGAHDLSHQGGKTRFDHKQIQAWDRQNEAQWKRKGHQGGRGGGDNTRDSTGGSNNSSSSHAKGKIGTLYRDRALERRNDVKDDSEEALAEIVSRLNPEQTKYLGGDIEHTHLVKGLDYALLNKSRLATSVQENAGEGDLHMDHYYQGNGSAKEVNVPFITPLGKKLYPILFSSSHNDDDQRSSKAGKQPLQGISFEFAGHGIGNTFVDDDVPVIVSRGNQVRLSLHESVVSSFAFLCSTICRKLTLSITGVMNFRQN